MINVYELMQQLLRKGIATPASLVGCSDTELAALEQRFSVRLPASYRAFLQAMGKRAGGLFQGTDMFYQDLPELRSWAEELLEEDRSDFRLPEDAFVFSMHQGYEFLYFRCSEGDDPPVYQYIEGKGQLSRPWDSFSAFVQDALGVHEQLME